MLQSILFLYMSIDIDWLENQPLELSVVSLKNIDLGTYLYHLKWLEWPLPRFLVNITQTAKGLTWELPILHEREKNHLMIAKLELVLYMNVDYKDGQCKWGTIEPLSYYTLLIGSHFMYFGLLIFWTKKIVIIGKPHKKLKHCPPTAPCVTTLTLLFLNLPDKILA